MEKLYSSNSIWQGLLQATDLLAVLEHKSLLAYY